jgi:hypothetical protein
VPASIGSSSVPAGAVRSDRTTESTPSSRRWFLRTVCGSRLPSQSRGTTSSTGPISVITVFECVRSGTCRVTGGGCVLRVAELLFHPRIEHAQHPHERVVLGAVGEAVDVLVDPT